MPHDVAVRVELDHLPATMRVVRAVTGPVAEIDMAGGEFLRLRIEEVLLAVDLLRRPDAHTVRYGFKALIGQTTTPSLRV